MTPSKFRAEIQAAADKYDLDPDLVEAMVFTESSDNPKAYRYEAAYRWIPRDLEDFAGRAPRRVKASYGLLQVMYPVAYELGFDRQPEDLYAPATALKYGCLLLRRLLKWSDGDVRAALAAYNGGKLGNAPGGPLRNASYADKVERHLTDVRNA